MISARHIERFVVIGLYALLFTPLLFWHQTMHPLGTVKALYFEILVSFLFAAYIPLALARPDLRPARNGITLAFIGFVAIMLGTSAIGVDFAHSFWGIPERMTGLFFLLHLAAFFLMLAGTLKGTAPWQKYSAFSSAVSFVVALFPALQFFFPGILFDVAAERFSGTIGNPIFLAAYLLFHVFIAGHLSTRFRLAGNRSLSAIFAVIALFDVAAVFMTQTRGALLGLCAGLIVLSVSYAIRPFFADLISPRRGRVALGAVWGVVILFSGFFFVTRANPAWQGVPVFGRLSTDGFRAGPRLMAWKIGLEAFADRPLAGWGFENFIYGFNAHYDPRFLRHGFGETTFDKPHNVFVQALAEGGLIGFGAYLILFGFLFRCALCEPWLAALLAAYLVQNFFAFDTLTSYIMLAVIVAYAASGQGADPHDARRMPSPPSMLLVAVLFAASGALAYAVQYPIWRANRAEWTAINEFVERRIPEGKAAFDEALAMKTPYIDYVRKDLAPIIGQMHQKNVGLPDERALVARAAEELRRGMRDIPLNYVFRAGFAEFVTTVYDLDPAYLAEAESVLAEAEILSPRRQTTLYLLSKISYLKGDKEGALDAMRRAVALDPEVGEPHFYYGMLLLESGDAAGAGREMDEADRLGRRARNAAEARVLAGYFGDADDYVRSIRYFSQALLLDPSDLETKTKLGLVYYLSGDYDAARNILREVLKKDDFRDSPQKETIDAILRELKLR